MWGKMTTPEKEKEGSPTLTAGTTIIRSSPTKKVSINWNQVVKNLKFREFVKDALSTLMVNTFDRYYGFYCPPDGIGCSRFDTTKAHVLNQRNNRVGIISARDYQDAVGLIYRYRRQFGWRA